MVSLLMLSTLLKKLAVAVGSAPTKPAETSAPEVFSARALVGSAALPPGLVVPVATAKDMVPSAGSMASGRQPARRLWPSALLSAHARLRASNLEKF